MNKEETKEAIKIMQAFIDGEEIQSIDETSSTSAWTDRDNPSWCWGLLTFRVKPPKPIGRWVVLNSEGKLWSSRQYETLEEAMAFMLDKFSAEDVKSFRYAELTDPKENKDGIFRHIQ